jgi:hypothetical protein
LIAAASAWVCVLAEDLPGDAAGRPTGVVWKELVGMEVMFERVAGLDVGKASVTPARGGGAARRGRSRR